jgi:CRP-like cAMP-binding protein
VSAPIQSSVQNRLLKALCPEDYDVLIPHMSLVDLPLRHVLVEPDQPTLYVHFMEEGIASVVAVSTDDESVEVGHLGREGLSGTHVLLMTTVTPNKTFMQVAGAGWRIPVPALSAVLKERSGPRELFLRYVHSCELQLAHSALANARFNMIERLARWLLMCHDRMEADDLPLTHEFLSLMLGVRRSGVTDQLHILEGIRAIKATRGNVRVLDRQKLVSLAGGCYGIPEREYERLVTH